MILSFCGIGLFFWNPYHDVELLAGFNTFEGKQIFTVSPPLIAESKPLPGSFFMAENDLVFGWKGSSNLDLCYEGMQNYIKIVENQFQDVLTTIDDSPILEEIDFLKDCILLSTLIEYDKQKVIDNAILYPCEYGGFRIIDECSKIITSNIVAVDHINKLFLTESKKVYVYNSLLIADLKSQEIMSILQ